MVSGTWLFADNSGGSRSRTDPIISSLPTIFAQFLLANHIQLFAWQVERDSVLFLWLFEFLAHAIESASICVQLSLAVFYISFTQFAGRFETHRARHYLRPVQVIFCHGCSLSWQGPFFAAWRNIGCIESGWESKLFLEIAQKVVSDPVCDIHMNHGWRKGLGVFIGGIHARLVIFMDSFAATFSWTCTRTSPIFDRMENVFAIIGSTARLQSQLFEKLVWLEQI